MGRLWCWIGWHDVVMCKVDPYWCHFVCRREHCGWHCRERRGLGR